MTFKLDPNIKKAWTQALRSGEYEQGEGQFSYKAQEGGRHYCCLGVLAAASGLLGREYADHCATFEDEVLPNKVQGRLIAMNDISGKSFEEIADYIEEKL